jgi:hypothetical protein
MAIRTRAKSRSHQLKGPRDRRFYEKLNQTFGDELGGNRGRILRSLVKSMGKDIHNENILLPMERAMYDIHPGNVHQSDSVHKRIRQEMFSADSGGKITGVKPEGVIRRFK